MAAPALAQSAHDRPWASANAILTIDPYEGNGIDWDAATADPRLKAVLHRASIGDRVDKAFLARAAEAHKRGLLWGAYHLGQAGDPRAQADLLVSLARKSGAGLLALDIEDLGPPNMSLDDAQIFINRVYEQTHPLSSTLHQLVSLPGDIAALR